VDIHDLLAEVPHRWVRGRESFGVDDVTHDSRESGPRVVFVAIRGAQADGVDFAAQAWRRGVPLVVVGSGRSGAPQLAAVERIVEVDQERSALAMMARALHGRSDQALRVVGVTGTKGKTTTCRIAADLLEAGGIRSGLLGTVGYWVGDTRLPAARTTPEAPVLHRHLERMREAGCRACVMEVSSHAIELQRVHSMEFSAAVFTNLTRDHLDFHKDMDSYFDVKARLFDALAPVAGGAPAAIINVDDPWGRKLAARLASRPSLRLITFGESQDATLRLLEAAASANGGSLRLATPEGEQVELTTPLLGRHNIWNVMAAACIGRSFGISWERIAARVARSGQVEGRLERVVVPGQDFTVLVDFAHTDEALRTVLEAVRPLTPGRVLVVFGCGGDRDRGKRPLMGAQAATLSDEVWITSDNPRSEDPLAIIRQIEQGARAAADRAGPRKAASIHIEPDRAGAIEAALHSARAGDTVVIAGKGHETEQILGDRRVPFDDRVVARTILARIVAGEGGGGAAHA